MIGLTGLEFDNNTQLDLFDEWSNRKKKLEPLMRTFDAINNKYGRGTIKLACGVRNGNGKEGGGFAVGVEAGLFIAVLYYEYQGDTKSFLIWENIDWNKRL